MPKIDEEIEQMADKLEKSALTPSEQLFNTIRELGPDGLKAKLSELSKSEKEVLQGALEEMKKAVSMDDQYQAKYVQGNINDTVIQEDKADDDQDEKLVKPEAAKHNHQGDVTPEGREGQVIKGRGPDKQPRKTRGDRNARALDAMVGASKEMSQDKDKRSDADKKYEEARQERKEKRNMAVTSKIKKSEEILEEIKKSDDMMYKMVSKMCGMGKAKKDIMDKCMAKGMDEKKVSSVIDRAMADHNKTMHKSEDAEYTREVVDGKEANVKKSDSMEKTRAAAETKSDGKAKKMLKEEDQLSDTDQMTEGKDRGDKKKPEELKTEKDNKAAQDKVNDMKQGKMKKSVEWSGANDLLKSGRGQQNHHFSVNEYYDEVIAKSKEEPGEGVEDLKKSDDGQEDLNDIIEKGGDTSADDVLTKSLIEGNKEKINGRLTKSFKDDEIAQALGLSEEEAKKILGE